MWSTIWMDYACCGLFWKIPAQKLRRARHGPSVHASRTSRYFRQTNHFADSLARLHVLQCYDSPVIRSFLYIPSTVTGKTVCRLLWPPIRSNGRPLYFAAVVSIFCLLLFFIACSQRSQTGCLPHFHTWRGLSANLECMSELCCTLGSLKIRDTKITQLEIWANAQRDGRHAEYRWRRLFNAAKFGWLPLPECHNWNFFASSYCWGATRRNVSRLAAVRRGRSVWAKISEGRGHLWGIFFGFYKTRHILLSDSANCTVLCAVVLTVPACDRQTDRRNCRS